MSNYNISLPSPDTDNIFKVGKTGNEFLFDAILYNVNDQFVRLRNQNITEFVIEDNFLNFYHKGYLIFRNDMDAIENIPENLTGVSEKQFSNISYIEQTKVLPYSFRGDCRDFLLVDIMPRLDNTNSNFDYGDNLNTQWRLKFLFSIYNTEDILTNEKGAKYKKLYFWDYTYQLLREKNLDFTTAKFANKKDVLIGDDSDRSIKTGEAVKNIIKTAFPAEEGYKIKFAEEFDEGYTDIFYSCPTDSKALDDLNYVMDRHVSSPGNNYDFCILRKERYSDKWSFRSLKSYFENAYDKSVTKNIDGGGSLHLEKFYIGNFSDSKVDNYNVASRAPTGPTNSAYLPDYSYIEDFNFSPPPGISVQEFLTSHFVNTYDFNGKAFVIDVNENDFSKSLKVYKDNYVNNMKGNIGKNPYTSLTKNEYRVSNINYDAEFTPHFESKDQRLSVGRNEFLKKALFLNNTLNFTAPGLTLRQSGRFISVDRQTSLPESKFDDKLLGTYFVVSVKHVFRNSDYKNEITCVKPYLFNDPKNTEEVY